MKPVISFGSELWWSNKKCRCWISRKVLGTIYWQYLRHQGLWVGWCLLVSRFGYCRQCNNKSRIRKSEVTGRNRSSIEIDKAQQSTGRICYNYKSLNITVISYGYKIKQCCNKKKNSRSVKWKNDWWKNLKACVNRRYYWQKKMRKTTN